MLRWKNWFVEYRQGTKYCYLVKDVTFQKKRKRIRHKVQINQETEINIHSLVNANYKILLHKFVTTRAQLISEYYTPQYISKQQVFDIEQAATLAIIAYDEMSLHEKKIYLDRFNIEYVHGTTSIEGNTLSKQQINDLLEYDLLPKNKTAREVFEIKNFEAVLKFRSIYKGKINLAFIKRLHELIIMNTGEDEPGVFRRNDQTIILGYDYPLCPSILIEDELSRIIHEYYDGIAQKKHTFELAVLFHRNFEVIHPFGNGNGRVGREIFNYMITKNGYPPMLFLGKERDSYISALHSGDEGDYVSMVIAFLEIYIKLYLSTIFPDSSDISFPV
jgi:Fic family protein